MAISPHAIMYIYNIHILYHYIKPMLWIYDITHAITIYIYTSMWKSYDVVKSIINYPFGEWFIPPIYGWFGAWFIIVLTTLDQNIPTKSKKVGSKNLSTNPKLAFMVIWGMVYYCFNHIRTNQIHLCWFRLALQPTDHAPPGKEAPEDGDGCTGE